MKNPTATVQQQPEPSTETIIAFLHDFVEDNRKSDWISFADCDLLLIAADRLSATIDRK
jgi:hypothetical protein